MCKILSAAILLAVLSAVNAFAQQNVFTIGVSLETGQAPELENTLSEAYARAGYVAQFIYAPRLRALKSADHGATHAIAVISKEALSAHPNLTILPTPLIEASVTAISLDPTVSITSRQDLGRYSVGVLRGQLLAVQLAKKTAARVDEVNTFKSLSSMLQHGRVDAVLLNRASARVFLSDAGIDKYSESDSLAFAYLYHAINRNAYEEEQAVAIDKALREMLEDGTMNELYGRLHQLVPTLPLEKDR